MELFVIVLCFMLHWRRHCLCLEHFAAVELDPAYNGDLAQFNYKVKTNRQNKGAQGNSCITESVAVGTPPRAVP